MTDISAIIWHLTNKCNFACDFCYTYSSPNEEYGLNDSDLVKIIREINNANPRKLSIIGGEPLLRKDLPFIINEINSEIDIYLDSNGSLFIKKWNNVFNKVKNINIGIDGSPHTNEIYRKNTGQVLNAVRFLLERGVNVSITMLVTSQNFFYIDKNIKYLFDLGVSDITINKYHKLFLEAKAINNLSKEQSNIALKKIILFLHSNPQYFERIFLYGWIDNLYFDIFSPSIKNHDCGCGKSKATINSYGDIVPCSVVAQKNNIDVFKQHFSIPNLLSTTIQKSFNSEFFSFFRDITTKTPEKCSSCIYNLQCHKGCRASAFLLNQDFLSVDANCQVAL